MASTRLESFREWLTPRKRFWTGIGLFAIAIVTPIVSPGTSVTWLIGPASFFFIGGILSGTNGKR